MTVKRLLVDGVIFLTGAAVGGAAAYFYVKKDEENRMNKEVNDIREALKKGSNKQDTDDDGSNRQDIGKPSNEAKNNLRTRSGASESTLMRDSVNTLIHKEKYSGYFDKANGMDPEIRDIIMEDVAEVCAEEEAPTEHTKPYFMTMEEAEVDDAERIFMTLYLGDQKLVEDAALTEVDVERTIGYDIFDKILTSHNDEYTVKNPEFDVIYDISKESMSFEEVMEDYHGGA